MTPQREKIQLFLLGLFLGLILGGGFFILKLDGYIKDLNIYRSKESKITEHEVSVDSIFPSSSKEKRTSKVSAQTKQNDYDSGKTTSDSTDARTLADDADVDIARDELFASRAIRVISFGKQSLASGKDSLVARVGGVNVATENPRYYEVEFWKSAVNARGYKLSKGNLMLYGIEQPEAVRLYQLEDDLYVRYYQQLYKLEFTGIQKSFESITDPELLRILE